MFTLTETLLIVASVLFIFCAFLIILLRHDTKVWTKIYKQNKYRKNPWDNSEMYVDEFGNFYADKKVKQ